MPTAYEVEAVVETVCEAVLEDNGVDNFEDLDKETLFTIALGCFAATRAAAVAALGSDAAAKDWFQQIITERWQNPDISK